MDSLLTKLCIRRLCLPSHINFDNVINGKVRPTNCMCASANHIACVFQPGKKKSLCSMC